MTQVTVSAVTVRWGSRVLYWMFVFEWLIYEMPCGVSLLWPTFWLNWLSPERKCCLDVNDYLQNFLGSVSMRQIETKKGTPVVIPHQEQRRIASSGPSTHKHKKSHILFHLTYLYRISGINNLSYNLSQGLKLTSRFNSRCGSWFFKKSLANQHLHQPKSPITQKVMHSAVIKKLGAESLLYTCCFNNSLIVTK